MAANQPPLPPAGTRYSLPISKLRGVPQRLRVVLKSRRITSCGQLLDAAGESEKRAQLVRTTGLDADTLLMLVQRADLARINGIGAVFGMMLEDLGARDVASVAAQDPVRLHEELRAYNQRERLARRSPTPEEVADWITQARALPILVTG
ncbi:MAG: DUF4332 domain-containing protein [Geminicoccaceae bacterium]|nr:DUF4332 domain-containing protein [Geminicoccaceae bacterium]